MRGEGLPADEFLDLSSVAGAVWREVDSVERSKRPVAGEESLLILGLGNFAPVPKVTPVGDPGPTFTTAPKLSL